MWLFTSLPSKAQNTHLNITVRDQLVSEERGTELISKLQEPNYGPAESSEGPMMFFVRLCMLPGELCGTKEVSSSFLVCSR